VRPIHFAYPWEYWSRSADEAVRHRYTLAILGGTPQIRVAPDHHRLHRYPVQLSDVFACFIARLRSGLRGEEWLRRILKGYAGP